MIILLVLLLVFKSVGASLMLFDLCYYDDDGNKAYDICFMRRKINLVRRVVSCFVSR